MLSEKVRIFDKTKWAKSEWPKSEWVKSEGAKSEWAKSEWAKSEFPQITVSSMELFLSSWGKRWLVDREVKKVSESRETCVLRSELSPVCMRGAVATETSCHQVKRHFSSTCTTFRTWFAAWRLTFTTSTDFKSGYRQRDSIFAFLFCGDNDNLTSLESVSNKTIPAPQQPIVPFHKFHTGLVIHCASDRAASLWRAHKRNAWRTQYVSGSGAPWVLIRQHLHPSHSCSAALVNGASRKNAQIEWKMRPWRTEVRTSEDEDCLTIELGPRLNTTRTFTSKLEILRRI